MKRWRKSEWALLAQDRLDLGIAFEMAQSAEVEAAPLFNESLELMVGADHPLASHRRPLTLAEWQHLPLALLSGDFATRRLSIATARSWGSGRRWRWRPMR